MTPESQRIAIAEASGLFRIMPLKRTTRRGKDDPSGVELWYCEHHHGGAAEYAKVPDYLNDLNAMHEAVAAQDEPVRRRFRGRLGQLCMEHNWGDPIDATAAQRAEAFLRTLNLWK